MELSAKSCPPPTFSVLVTLENNNRRCLHLSPRCPGACPSTRLCAVSPSFPSSVPLFFFFLFRFTRASRQPWPSSASPSSSPPLSTSFSGRPHGSRPRCSAGCSAARPRLLLRTRAAATKRRTIRSRDSGRLQLRRRRRTAQPCRRRRFRRSCNRPQSPLSRTTSSPSRRRHRKQHRRNHPATCRRLRPFPCRPTPCRLLRDRPYRRPPPPP